MTIAADARLRPAADADYRAPSRYRSRGLVLAFIGLVVATAAFVGNLVAVGQTGADQASTLAWTFGVTTTGFAVIKTAIAVVLWGILMKLWLRAGYFLKKKPGATIVHDLRSSRIVSETVLRAGGTPQRSRVGPAFMKKMAVERQAVFSGELSGHYYFQDNWYGDSGLLAFVHTLNVLSQSGRPLSSLIAPYRKYAASGERNFITDEKEGTIQKLGRLYETAKVDFLDGVTVQHPEWWFNVRQSSTEPLLRLNLEANTPELLDQKLAEVAQHLGEAVDP